MSCHCLELGSPLSCLDSINIFQGLRVTLAEATDEDGDKLRLKARMQACLGHADYISALQRQRPEFAERLRGFQLVPMQLGRRARFDPAELRQWPDLLLDGGRRLLAPCLKLRSNKPKPRISGLKLFHQRVLKVRRPVHLHKESRD